MTQQVGTLSVAITGSSAGLQAAFVKAQQAATEFQRNITAVTGRIDSKIGASFAAVASHVKSFGGAMVGAAAAYATFSTVSAAFERGDSLGKTAAALGMTVEQLQRLQAAAVESGSSMSGMNNSLLKMSQFISAASDSGSDAAQILRNFGTSAASLKEAGTEEAFYRLAEGLNTVTNSQDRYAMSQMIFGKEARNMAELVGMGAEAIKQTGLEAERTGRVLSKLEVSALKDAGDEIEKLKGTIETMSGKAIAAVADDFSWMAQEARKATEASGSVGTILGIVTETAKLAVAVVLDLWRVVDLAFTALKGLGSGIGYALSAALEKAVQFVTYLGRAIPGLVDLFAGMAKVIWGSLDYLFQNIKGGFLELFKWLSMNIAGKMRNLGELFKQFGIAGGESLAQLGMDFENWAMTVDTDVKRGIESASGRVKIGTDQMRGALDGLGNVNGKSFVSGWFADLKDEFAGATQKTVDYFNRIASESSIHNLVMQWAGVSTEIEKANEAATGPSVAPVRGAAPAMRVTTDDEQAAIDKLSDEWKGLYDKAAQARADFMLGAMGPVEAERTVYAERLAALEAFNAEAIGKESEKMEAIASLRMAHEGKMRDLVADAEMERLNLQTQYSDLSLAQRFESFEAMRAIEDQRLADKLAAAQSEWAAGQATDEQAYATQEAAYAAHETAMTKIKQTESQLRMAAEQMVLGAMGNMFGAFAAAMDQKKRKEFMMWKAFSIAQATISTYLAATNAMASAATMGPAAAIAATAMIVAAGMANVIKIATTQYQGGGSAGGGGGGATSQGNGTGASTDERSAGSTSQVNVSLYGNNFSAGQVRGLIGAINEQAGDNMTLKAQVM